MAQVGVEEVPSGKWQGTSGKLLKNKVIGMRANLFLLINT